VVGVVTVVDGHAGCLSGEDWRTITFAADDLPLQASGDMHVVLLIRGGQHCARGRGHFRGGNRGSAPLGLGPGELW